jgi:nucleotide-binding universal stress UspA family protein
MKTILAPIDFSAAGELVVAEAVTLASALNARLILMHVMQPPVVTDSEIGSQMSSEYAATGSAETARRLAGLEKQLQAQSVMVETRHLVGLPGHCILELARTLGVDYIVLGSHGHGAFYELVVGSTTSRVLKHTHRPVIVVPQRRRNLQIARAERERLP